MELGLRVENKVNDINIENAVREVLSYKINTIKNNPGLIIGDELDLSKIGAIKEYFKEYIDCGLTDSEKSKKYAILMSSEIIYTSDSLTGSAIVLYAYILYTSVLYSSKFNGISGIFMDLFDSSFPYSPKDSTQTFLYELSDIIKSINDTSISYNKMLDLVYFYESGRKFNYIKMDELKRVKKRL